MRGADRVGQRNRQLEQTVERQAAMRNQHGQRLALDDLHRQEVRGPGKLDRVDGDDVGVVEGGDGLRLALEALAAFVIHAERRRQHLERDLTVQLLVLGGIDLAHAAAAELPYDAVMAEGGADHRWVSGF